MYKDNRVWILTAGCDCNRNHTNYLHLLKKPHKTTPENIYDGFQLLNSIQHNLTVILPQH